MRYANLTVWAIAALTMGPAFAAGKSAARAPDLSGWWIVELRGPPPRPGAPNSPGAPPPPNAANDDANAAFPQLPFKPEYRELIEKLAAYENGEIQEKPPGAKPYRTCEQFRFNGLFSATAEAAMEFLVTPGRITITDEAGQLRRIYMDRKLPTDVDESFSGTSVGHWEGKTLVIETTGINRHNQLFVLGGGFPLGPDARSVERLALVEPDLLRIESTVTAPAVLTRPHTTISKLRRDRNHVPHEFSYCDDTDRYLDPANGAIFFDLTPPADIPPPPAN